MNIEEDTCEWLSLPTPLEMCKQHALLLENEIQELNLQLRKAREDIFGLIKMLADAEAVKTEFRGYLTTRGAEAAAMRQEISDWTATARSNRREADDLRQMLNDLRSQSKTNV